jgi:hypothetical protein
MRSAWLRTGWLIGGLCLLAGCSLGADSYEASSSHAAGASGGPTMPAEGPSVAEPPLAELPVESDPDSVLPREPSSIADQRLDELEGGTCANGCAIAGQQPGPAEPGEAQCRAELYWQSPGWVEVGQNLATDSLGNAYFAGTAADNVTLGPFTVNADQRSVGFVTKLGPDCSPILLKELGGDAGSQVHIFTIAIDHEDNWIVSGELNGTADFGLGPITTLGRPADESGSSGLVLKLSPDGRPLWQRLLSSKYAITRVHDIDVTATGDIVVTGASGQDIHFEGMEPSTDVRGYGRFVAYLSASGEPGQLHAVLGIDAYVAVAVDASGRAAVTGFTHRGYGTGPFAEVPWSQELYDHYLLTLDPSGALERYETFEQVTEDDMSGSFGTAIEFDRSGNLIVEHGRSHYNEGDTYTHHPETLQKHAPDGALVWSLTSQYQGGGAIYWLNDLTTDSQDNIVHVDELVPGVTLDGATFEPRGARDFLVRKRDPEGGLLWSAQLGSDREDLLIGLSVDRDDAVWVGLTTEEPGYFRGTLAITKLAP